MSSAKAEKVRKYFKRHPSATAADVAKMFRITKTSATAYKAWATINKTYGGSLYSRDNRRKALPKKGKRR